MMSSILGNVMRRGAGYCSISSAERLDLNEILGKLRPIGEGSVKLSSISEREACIQLKNTGRKNAFSGKMMAEMWDAIDELSTDKKFKIATCLYIKGTDDFFCSGADLKVLKEFSPNDGVRMSWLMQRALHRMRMLPLISVAVINGGAVGGGTELSLSCDFRVMEHGATFQMIHTRNGLVPGWGGGSRLVKTLGRRKALKVLSSGTKFTHQESFELGIADAISGVGEKADAAAERLMRPFVQDVLYPNAVRGTKQIVGYADDNADMEQCLEYEREVFSDVWGQRILP